MSKAVKKSGVALVALQGARSAPGSATSAPSTGAEVKRWSANRKKEVVLRLLRGEPIDTLSRELGIETYRLARASAGGLGCGSTRAGRGSAHAAVGRSQVSHWRAHHGDRAAAPGKAGAPPFGIEEVVAMSAEISPGAGWRYGLERVCRVLEVPRSTIYAKRAAESRKVVALRPKRRGPAPKMSDEKLLEAIRADLAASPFVGEGYRKP